MAAPSGIKWGSTAGDYARIGIYVSLADGKTSATPTVEVWIWTKYSLYDSSNKLYFNNNSSSASSAVKSNMSISTTSNSGGWSTTNQKKLYSVELPAVTKGTSSKKIYCAAKLTGIEHVGATMTVSTYYTIPALTKYTISFDANGGSGQPASQSKYYGKSTTLSETKPARTGYTFKGWSTAKDNTVEYESGESYTLNSSVKLYAVWEIIKYTVKYNANGGSGQPADDTKNYGETITLSAVKPTRTNYNFKGWSTSSTGSVAYASGANYSKNASVTLYAVWELAYEPPAISNLKVERCNSAGTPTESGTYALVSFSWSCNQTTGSNPVKSPITIECSGFTTVNVSATGNSGTVSKVVGGSLSLEKSYIIKITVSDNKGGITPETKTINLAKYNIRLMKNGIAFGKEAELEGYADFDYMAKFRKNADFNANVNVDGTINANGDINAKAHIYNDTDVTVIGNVRFNERWIGFYPTFADAKANTNRNAYVGFKNAAATEFDFSGASMFNFGEFKASNIACGGLTITPSGAEKPTKATISFGKTFKRPPVVVVGLKTTVPGSTVMGCSCENVTTTGCDIYLTRVNTTTSKLQWIAFDD